MVVKLSRMLPFKRAKKWLKKTRRSWGHKACLQENSSLVLNLHLKETVHWPFGPAEETVDPSCTSNCFLWEKINQSIKWTTVGINSCQNTFIQTVNSALKKTKNTFPHYNLFSILCEILWWRLPVSMLPLTVDKDDIFTVKHSKLPNRTFPFCTCSWPCTVHISRTKHHCHSTQQVVTDEFSCSYKKVTCKKQISVLIQQH